MVEHRSVSQAEDMGLAGKEGCGYRYYLKRVAEPKVWKRPAAWLPQGTAFHEAVERFERSGGVMTPEDTVTAFTEAYSREIGALSADTPNHWVWFASGPYRGPQDIERRYGLGAEQIERYIAYKEAHPEERIVTLNDQPAIELAYQVMFGKVEVRGYIDQVVAIREGKPFPRDLKTGKTPGSDFQLATYAYALLLLHGVEVTVGDYWMAQKGGPTHPYDLTEWTLEHLIDIYGRVDEKIRNEEFEPNPKESLCRMCDVYNACEYRVGEQF